MVQAIKERIDAFLQIREMPFIVATREGEVSCCCSDKAALLEKRLRELGLQSRRRLCWFKWDALGLPDALMSVPHEELPSHEFLEVYLPEHGRWVIVDPTWDSALASILPVADWDGISDTRCAVPIERICSDAERGRMHNEWADPIARKEYYRKEGPFLRGLNDYLAASRRK